MPVWPCLDYVSMACETPTGMSTSHSEKWDFDINILYCRLEAPCFKFQKLLCLIAGTLYLFFDDAAPFTGMKLSSVFGLNYKVDF
jgi:hypothetical protein